MTSTASNEPLETSTNQGNTTNSYSGAMKSFGSKRKPRVIKVDDPDELEMQDERLAGESAGEYVAPMP